MCGLNNKLRRSLNDTSAANVLCDCLPVGFFRGGGSAASSTAAVEVDLESDAATGNAAEEEKESMINSSEQSEMWAN